MRLILFQWTPLWFLALTLSGLQPLTTPAPGESDALVWPPWAPSTLAHMPPHKHIVKNKRKKHHPQVGNKATEA